MGLSFESNMTIVEILEGSDKVVLANIDLLAKDYLEKKDKKLNKGCSSCIIEMVLTLKNYYKMTQFKFKRHAASYKDKKGDKTTISNSTMTDEKALKFLKTNPKRIELFSEYPSNWKKLIKGKIETEAEKEARLAAEAEAAAAAAAAAAGNGEGSEGGEGGSGEGGSGEGSGNTEGGEGGEGSEGNEGEGSSDDSGSGSTKPSREELMKMTLKDLRDAYPKVKATSIKDFVEKVLAE